MFSAVLILANLNYFCVNYVTLLRFTFSFRRPRPQLFRTTPLGRGVARNLLQGDNRVMWGRKYPSGVQRHSSGVRAWGRAHRSRRHNACGFYRNTAKIRNKFQFTIASLLVNGKNTIRQQGTLTKTRPHVPSIATPRPCVLYCCTVLYCSQHNDVCRRLRFSVTFTATRRRVDQGRNQTFISGGGFCRPFPSCSSSPSSLSYFLSPASK